MDYWINALMVPADQLLPLAVAADELGYAGIALADHAAMPDVIDSSYPGGAIPWADDQDWPDPWVQIGAMAAVTRRLRFATNVWVLPARHPLVTAKAVATAARISDDRVILGAGVGWMAEEFAALDSDFATRGARADEILDILQRAWRGGSFTYRGRYYDLPALRLDPAPRKPIPIWIGGESPAALRRAARYGDGWISGRPAQGLERQIETLQSLREQHGRATHPFTIAASAATQPTDTDLATFENLGIHHLKLQPWTWTDQDPEPLDTKLKALQTTANALGVTGGTFL